MNEGNVLNHVLQQALNFINSGFGLIRGDVYWLFAALLVINLTLAGLTWATSRDDMLVAMARRVFYIGFFAWLVMNWPTLIDTVGSGFVRLGLEAGRGLALQSTFYNPGRIVSTGWHGAWAMVEDADKLTGIRGTFVNFPQIMVLLLAAVVYFVSFALLAFQVFLALVQFKIGALASFILLPMALLNKTAFLAERPIGWLFASGMRLMVLALVMAMGTDLIKSIAATNDMTIRQAVAAALGATALFLLARMTSSMASDLVQGSPSLGIDAGPVAAAPMRKAGGGASRLAGAAGMRGAGLAGRGARFAAVATASALPGGAAAVTAAQAATDAFKRR